MPDHDETSDLNRILSEVIDFVQDVKQAGRKIPATQPLHGELDQLLDDVGAWARQLIEQDEILGVSPLAAMPSVAGRTPPNLWPGTPSSGEVIRLLDDHLARLERHVADALSTQTDPGMKAPLANVRNGAGAHRKALAEFQRS